jgi:hypothetical protein
MTKFEEKIREDYGHILSEEEILQALKKLEKYAGK